jgi:hypothetical protein
MFLFFVVVMPVVVFYLACLSFWNSIVWRPLSTDSTVYRVIMVPFRFIIVGTPLPLSLSGAF